MALLRKTPHKIGIGLRRITPQPMVQVGDGRRDAQLFLQGYERIRHAQGIGAAGYGQEDGLSLIGREIQRGQAAPDFGFDSRHAVWREWGGVLIAIHRRASQGPSGRADPRRAFSGKSALFRWERTGAWRLAT